MPCKLPRLFEVGRQQPKNCPVPLGAGRITPRIIRKSEWSRGSAAQLGLPFGNQDFDAGTWEQHGLRIARAPSVQTQWCTTEHTRPDTVLKRVGQQEGGTEGQSIQHHGHRRVDHHANACNRHGRNNIETPSHRPCPFTLLRPRRRRGKHPQYGVSPSAVAPKVSPQVDHDGQARPTETPHATPETPDELPVAARTKTGNDPTLEGPVIFDGHARGHRLH